MSSKQSYLIKGGRVVNDDWAFDADVLIENGLIKSVAKDISPPKGVEVINAEGKLVMPGGIDPHTHFQFPFMGSTSIDDFFSGTQAALAGGTTTIIDFAAPAKGVSLLEGYKQWREWADAKVTCDYALHLSIFWWSDQVREEMGILAKEHGINSFKVYMAYKGTFQMGDTELINVLIRCKELGALGQVHAENGDIVVENQQRLLAMGIRGPEGHEQSRPEEVEAEATGRAIMLAHQVNCPLYVVHVSSRSAALAIADARRKGYVVFGEPLAAGLAADGEQQYHSCWRHAAAHVTSPPLRKDRTTQDALMDGLANNDLQLTGTDHCTFTAEQKAIGKDDFTKIPFGVNGVEERMSIVWEKGVKTGKIDPCRYVAITSTNAAKIFNMYPKKGRIQAGSDADIMVFDPEAEKVISVTTHHAKVDFNIFEGLRVRGIPVHVFTGGRLAVRDQKLLPATPGSGKFIPCQPYSPYVYNCVQERDEIPKWVKVERDGKEDSISAKPVGLGLSSYVQG